MLKKITEEKKINFIANSYLVIGIVLVLIGTIVIILARYPQVWYSLEINTVENEFVTLTKPIEEDLEKFEEEEIEEKGHILPELDFSLPIENYIYIEKIGVDGKIHEGQNPEEALDKGVWRVYDFGTPEDENPVILSSHRFGYFNWTQEQRTKHSFYNLPSTRVGDKIEVVWNQRKYIYEIHKIEEGERITNYESDLILYTCKLYNSPIRIFRYANRVN